MKIRSKAILLSIILTVIPSTFCLAVLGVGNLSSGANFAEIVLLPLPAMVLIGGVTGLGTSVIFPKWWLVVVGSQLGWIGGLFGAALVAELLFSPHDPLSAVYAYTLLICCGFVAGLLPALIARFLKGAR